VFQGTAGTVTVNGAQTITGLQFVTDGYSLQNGTAGALNLVNGSLGNATVRVDPNATATLGVALNGSGTSANMTAVRWCSMPPTATPVAPRSTAARLSSAITRRWALAS
jgi:hypothetical protein